MEDVDFHDGIGSAKNEIERNERQKYEDGDYAIIAKAMPAGAAVQRFTPIFPHQQARFGFELFGKKKCREEHDAEAGDQEEKSDQHKITAINIAPIKPECHQP